MVDVRLQDRPIGPEEPCFVIAEAGVNHNGDVDMALDLVEAAAEAGADAVKFQSFQADHLASSQAPKADYQQETTGELSQREMLERLELPRKAYAQLQNHAREHGLVFLSSPFDSDSVRFLADQGVPAIKIPSGEITNQAYLETVAETDRPAILSTGMSDLGEVEAAVEILEPSDGGLVILHCLSEYPAPPDEVNLRAMDTLRSAFGVPVGFSDHTRGSTVPVAAVARGADVIEKHFTLDRGLPGPDHEASIEPHELGDLVDAIRTAEAALGDGRKRPAPSEETNREIVRKSLALVQPKEEGEPIHGSDLTAIRPATGIPPTRRDQTVGRELAVDKAALEPLDWGDLR